MIILTVDDNNKLLQDLDQFYTTNFTAKFCTGKLILAIKKLGCNIESIEFVEPSGGDGVFIDELKRRGISKIRSYDLDPKHKDIIKKDFLNTRLKYKDNRIFLGNPPFGKKASLAIQFFNNCADMGSIIAFIVPIQFRKWSVQSKLDVNMKLILDVNLKENSFRTVSGKPYEVRCCFQIWTKLKYPINKRLKKPPVINHNDFKIWQYNNTKSSLKYFENNFDFAVPRQGYADYSRRETNKDNCEKTTQWMLIKAKNKKILKRLLSLDYEKLSKLNIITPGFGKADVIKEYMRLWK